MAELSVAARRHQELLDKLDKLETALVGTDKEPGYFERVRSLEAWTLTQKKAYTVLGAAIGVDIVTRLFGLIAK